MSFVVRPGGTAARECDRCRKRITVRDVVELPAGWARWRHDVVRASATDLCSSCAKFLRNALRNPDKGSL